MRKQIDAILESKGIDIVKVLQDLLFDDIKITRSDFKTLKGNTLTVLALDKKITRGDRVYEYYLYVMSPNGRIVNYGDWCVYKNLEEKCNDMINRY